MSTSASSGEPFAFAGVYDGHGGSAVAEWLTQKLAPIVGERFSPRNPEGSLTDAYLKADKQLLTASNGFLGLGEAPAGLKLRVCECCLGAGWGQGQGGAGGGAGRVRAPLLHGR
jgi:hypothetical protein